MMLQQLDFWLPVAASVAGTNGMVWGLFQWRLNHKKTTSDTKKSGADTAEVFTRIAETIATRAEQAAQREHDDAEQLRAEVRALRAEVEELRPLRAEVLELRRRLATMQQDVTATRSAVERQSIVEEMWLGGEAQEPEPNSSNE